MNSQQLQTPVSPNTKPELIRSSTSPTSINTPPSSVKLHGDLNRQLSASPSMAPVSAVTHYIKHLLGLNPKTTKRSLSEEAECGSPESINEWLYQGSDPNEVDAYGYTPLVNACLRGCIKSVKILLTNGADVNKKAMYGYSPLHAASQVKLSITEI